MSTSKSSASNTPIIAAVIVVVLGVVALGYLVVSQNKPKTTTTPVPAAAVVSNVTPLAGAHTPAEYCANAVPASAPSNRKFSQADKVMKEGTDYSAVFCTDVGPVYIDLLEHNAPIAVNNFIFLSQQGYYNNTTFHRVIQDFMAQGGDPTGTGTGDPGYSFGLENVDKMVFDQPGLLAMANTGQPNSNGSQFFITTVPYPSLNNGYTIFGKVLQGQDIVNKIKLRDPDTATTAGTALQTVVIIDNPGNVKPA